MLNNDGDDVKRIFQKKFRKEIVIEELHKNDTITAKISFSKKLVINNKKTKKDRWLLLIGNGLCRAFQKNSEDYYKDAFSLDFIINQLFKNKNYKEIESCIANIKQSNQKLSTEDALGIFQSLAETQKHLNPNGKLSIEVGQTYHLIQSIENYKFYDFKYHVLRKIAEASSELQSENEYKKFIKKLMNFLKEVNSRTNTIVDIATLNYDTSLYVPFFTNLHDNWFKKNYTDGFLRNKNDLTTENQICSRLLKEPRGRYLHLHGSYLFLQNEDKKGTFFKEKKSTSYIPSEQNKERTVVILSNQTEKHKLVKYHDLLNQYHICFNDCLQKAKKLIIFGYGGKDEYLNSAISTHLNSNVNSSLELIVIDRLESTTDWKKELNLPSRTIIQKVRTEKELLYQENKCKIFQLDYLRNFNWEH